MGKYTRIRRIFESGLVGYLMRKFFGAVFREISCVIFRCLLIFGVKYFLALNPHLGGITLEKYKDYGRSGDFPFRSALYRGGICS